MSDKSIFEKREAAFEAEYFNRKESETIEKLKRVFHQKVDAESITKATGVTDPQIVGRMVELNLKGELMSAFQLYPLIEVAWADGHVDEAETKLVLEAAEKRGIAKGTQAYGYLEERLKTGPSTDLRAIWMSYAGQLKNVLTKAELDAFRTDITDLCHDVAKASGGVLGNLFAVDSAEKKLLAKITSALSY